MAPVVKISPIFDVLLFINFVHKETKAPFAMLTIMQKYHKYNKFNSPTDLVFAYRS